MAASYPLYLNTASRLALGTGAPTAALPQVQYSQTVVLTPSNSTMLEILYNTADLAASWDAAGSAITLTNKVAELVEAAVAGTSKMVSCRTNADVFTFLDTDRIDAVEVTVTAKTASGTVGAAVWTCANMQLAGPDGMPIGHDFWQTAFRADPGAAGVTNTTLGIADPLSIEFSAANVRAGIGVCSRWSKGSSNARSLALAFTIKVWATTNAALPTGCPVWSLTATKNAATVTASSPNQRTPVVHGLPGGGSPVAALFFQHGMRFTDVDADPLDGSATALLKTGYTCESMGMADLSGSGQQFLVMNDSANAGTTATRLVAGDHGIGVGAISGTSGASISGNNAIYNPSAEAGLTRVSLTTVGSNDNLLLTAVNLGGTVVGAGRLLGASATETVAVSQEPDLILMACGMDKVNVSASHGQFDGRLMAVAAKDQTGTWRIICFTRQYQYQWDAQLLSATGTGNQGALSVTGGTGGVSSTALTINVGGSGFMTLGRPLSGTGIAANTWAIAYASGGSPGGAGVYTLNQAATVANGTTITASARAAGNVAGHAGFFTDGKIPTIDWWANTNYSDWPNYQMYIATLNSVSSSLITFGISHIDSFSNTMSGLWGVQNSLDVIAIKLPGSLKARVSYAMTPTSTGSKTFTGSDWLLGTMEITPRFGWMWGTMLPSTHINSLANFGADGTEGNGWVEILANDPGRTPGRVKSGGGVWLTGAGTTTSAKTWDDRGSAWRLLSDPTPTTGLAGSLTSFGAGSVTHNFTTADATPRVMAGLFVGT